MVIRLPHLFFYYFFDDLKIGYYNSSIDFTGTETAADLNPGNSIAITVRAKWDSATYDYAYTGGEQTFTAPATGYYKLEVWGGQGGKSYGYGGYSVGITQMSINKSLYVNVGGAGIFCSTKGAVCLGGYNGGGNGHAATYAWSGTLSANPTNSE